MEIYRKLFFILAFGLILNQVSGKSMNSYKKYVQITDKEILIETQKGSQILFTAFDDQSLKVSTYEKNESIQLITPETYFVHTDLLGSIYMQELNELLQITTTSKEGFTIRIDKKPFKLTVVDKSDNHEIVLDLNSIHGGIMLTSQKQINTNLAERISE